MLFIWYANWYQCIWYDMHMISMICIWYQCIWYAKMISNSYDMQMISYTHWLCSSLQGTTSFQIWIYIKNSLINIQPQVHVSPSKNQGYIQSQEISYDCKQLSFMILIGQHRRNKKFGISFEIAFLIIFRKIWQWFLTLNVRCSLESHDYHSLLRHD